MMTTPEAKMSAAIAKLQRAFQIQRPTIQLGGLAATDPRLAHAAVEAGVMVLEPNHTAISCARALRGLTSMREAYAYKQELPFSTVLEVIAALRRVVPEHVFILSAAPGTFDEAQPRFEPGQAEQLAAAGADGLFVEKNDLREVERLAGLAHAAGLITQSAFQLCPDGGKASVIPVAAAAEVPKVVRRMAESGVDIIGMRLSGIFKITGAKALAEPERDCLIALAEEMQGPTVVYAGVSIDNYPAIAATGVKMVGLASAADELIYRALNSGIAEFRKAGAS